MASILEELANAARERVANEQARLPLAKLKKLAAATPEPLSFRAALARPGMSFICECKKASPSKGLIEPDFEPVTIARDYEAAGAAAISVLTEPTRFLGSNEYLRDVAKSVSIPVLRKDFTVDAYMVYQARALGASAVLLICSLLNAEELAALLAACKDAGIDALVEAHDATEVQMAVTCGAQIIGVNNRNLADFTVDFGNSLRLRSLVPEGIAFVTESGVKTASDVELLEQGGVDAVLVGEALMRAHNKRAELRWLQGEGRFNPACDSSCNNPKAPSQYTGARDLSQDANSVRVKICGLKQQEDIQAINNARPDFAGFILSRGFRRSVNQATFIQLASQLDPSIAKVGVFVNEPITNIASLAADARGLLDFIQLHGNEDESYLAELRRSLARCGKAQLPLIQAFTVRTQKDIERARASTAEYVLFDNGKGTGEAFDWTLLKEVDRPFFLAGGLNPDNVSEAAKRLHPFAVDMSSGVEAYGQKDPEKIQQAVQAVRAVQTVQTTENGDGMEEA